MKANALIAGLAGWLWLAGFCAQADPPVLGTPIIASPYFVNFTLAGDSNATYVIERSTDLQTWNAVLTNTTSHATRTIGLEAGGVQSFFRARRFPMPMFRAASLAQSRILLGTNAEVDSFDSADPNHSTDGRYDPAKSKDTALVAAYDGGTNSTLDLGDAKVFGRVQTAQGSAVTIGMNGSVGSGSWVLSGQNGIEPGHYSNDLDLLLPPANPPWPYGAGGAFTPSAGAINGTNYVYILGNGRWELASINLSGQNKILVNGHTILYVRGNISLSGASALIITTNATLKLYVGGRSASLSGQGVRNSSGNPTNFSYYGLATNLSVSTHSFIGTIYAPNAQLNISGASQVTGVCVGRSISIGASVRWHFDEHLTRAGPVF